MTFYELYQYYLNKNKGGGEGIESITDSTQYIPIPPREGGGDNDFQGGGKFGNLDLDDTKTFNKEVWEVGGPANQYGSWVDTDVTGYLNPKTGHYQTFEGKNINHLGIEVPTIAGMLFDKNFGQGPQPGDIKGLFTDGVPQNWKDSISNIGNPFKKNTGIASAYDYNIIGDSSVDSEENQPGDGGNIITNTDQSGTGDGDGGSGNNKFAGDSGNKAGTTGSWSPGGTYTSSNTSNQRRHHALAEGGRVKYEYGATKKVALIRMLFNEAGGEEGTGKSFEKFMADVLFEGDYLD